MIDKKVWGHLYDRYAKKRPRKILSIDGGGIRGVIALGILQQMEDQLKAINNADHTFRLCNYFDYIGGTSTGAIIAASLALGKSVSDIWKMYRTKGEAMFDKAFLMAGGKHKYDPAKLRAELQDFFGENTNLLPEHLQCLLLVVTMNVDTDSPWPISSNPDAKYNKLDRDDCNLHIPMWKLVRASTAAPFYFKDEEIVLGKRKVAFVDGGVTPHNNPAWLLYRMATNPMYNLSWDSGEKELLIASVGTGLFTKEGRYKTMVDVAKRLSPNLLSTMSIEKDASCRHVGRCTFGASIDSEIKDLIPRRDGNIIPLDEDLGRAFLYARYNADISQVGLDKLGLSKIKAENVQQMDSVKYIEELYDIGQAAGEEVDVEQHFGPFATQL